MHKNFTGKGGQIKNRHISFILAKIKRFHTVKEGETLQIRTIAYEAPQDLSHLLITHISREKGDGRAPRNAGEGDTCLCCNAEELPITFRHKNARCGCCGLSSGRTKELL
eukprot:144544-Amorphochlora_amoeboformis.AAC.1